MSGQFKTLCMKGLNKHSLITSLQIKKTWKLHSYNSSDLEKMPRNAKYMAHSEPSQASRMEFFVKIIDSWKVMFDVFILHAWLSSGYAFGLKYFFFSILVNNGLYLINLKGSLHTAIFWKYTELFNILKIFSSVTW